MPHGVWPFAQLFTVPRVAEPSGEYLVIMYFDRAAGPLSLMGVSVWMRRL